MQTMHPSDDEGHLAIAAVSELLEVPIPTIRSWERRYGFPTPVRTRGKHRRYSIAEADQLRMLRDEIARGHPTKEAVELVRRASQQTVPRHELFERFLRLAMRMDPTGLRETLQEAADTLGVEQAIRDVALPAMREMGSRWKAGVCDTAHEHLATEAVRAWLARLSTLAPPPFRPSALVLACGPKDLHSIGLEAFGVILARRGWSVRSLGALTPVEALVVATRVVGARGAVVTSQRSVTRRAAVEALAAVDAVPGVRPFYAGMAFAPSSARRDIPGTYLGQDILEGAIVLERALGEGP
jgi:DNA-binding transcriptional MerR regulator